MLALQFEVDSLELKIESNADGAAAKVDALTAALANLKKTARVPKGLSDVAVLLERINKFSGANLNINLDAGKAKEFSGAMKSITKESRKSEDALKDVNKQTKVLGTSESSVNLRSLIKGIYGFTLGAYRKIKSLVDMGTDYVETINLAQVAMKGYFEEAKAYADLVNDKLGVDPALWLKEQATFMAMATGFGFAEDKAYKLSKALTELSYDISSLYNEDINKASLRLQSALAGEIEPIRRLGISISQATLEEFALAKGITESVSAMTEQEKSLLRTLKLIEDSSKIGAVGDLARTIEQPANALRVLNQQFTQLKRTVGTTFIPALIQIVPYLQAGVELLTDIVERIATLVGFEMPKWDNSSWDNIQNGAEGAAGAIDDATEAVKKLKRQTLGFDELNVLSANEDTTDGLGGTSDWIKDLEIPSLWDENVLNQIADKTSQIKEDITPIVAGFGTFAGILLSLKFADAFTTIFNKLEKTAGEGRFKKAVGVSLIVSGITLAYDAGVKIAQNDAESTLSAIKSVAASAVGGYLIGGGPGALIGLSISLVTTIGTALIELNKESKQRAIEKFKETDAGKIVTEAMAALNEVAANSPDLQLKIKSITGEISATDAGKIELARQLINDIYGLSEKDNLSSTELELISGWVTTLNSLGLDGLQLEFNTVTGEISKTREEVERLLTDIENTVRLSAMTNALTNSYTVGNEAKREYEKALDAYNKLMSIDVNSLEGSARKEVISDRTQAIKTLKDAAKNYMDATESIEYYTDALGQLRAEIDGVDYNAATREITKFAKDAAKAMADAKNDIGLAFNGISADIKDFVKKFGSLVGPKASLVGGIGKGAVMVQISAFADGGFPTMGSLFIANEAGPEMVGTIGGRPAVANNDQIVAGVANGVASANATQNALLREQNNILLEILNKTGAVSLDGKMLDRSIEQYRNNRGASIMSGGVR